MEKNEVPDQPGCLIYDSQCRLCVTVKRKIEQRSKHVQFVPYDSQKAAQYLGNRYQSDHRPNMAYWVDEKGTVVDGVEAFLPFLHGLTSGEIFLFLWKFRVWRQAMLTLYEFVAKHRYRWFGVSDEP